MEDLDRLVLMDIDERLQKMHEIINDPPVSPAVLRPFFAAIISSLIETNERIKALENAR
jgi:hypothetical protein